MGIARDDVRKGLSLHGAWAIRVAAVLSICLLGPVACAPAALAQSERQVVIGPTHTPGSVLQQSISTQCLGHEVIVRWNSHAVGVTLKIDGAPHWFGSEAPFAREMFAPGTRPASYWMRCRDDDFEIGATIVTASPEGPVFNVPVVWFTFDGALGGYTGMQVEATEVALRGLD